MSTPDPVPAISPNPPPPPHITAAVVVLLVGLLAAIWLVADWSVATRVLLSTPLAAFAVAFGGQFVRAGLTRRRGPRA